MKPYNDVYLIKRLAKYLFKDKLFIIVILISLTLNMLCDLIFPIILGEIIDNLVNRRINNQIFQFLFFYVFVFCLGLIANLISFYFLNMMGENAIYHIRKDTYLKLQDLSIDFFDETPKGDIQSRLSNDLDLLNPILSGQVVYAIYSVIFLFAMLIILLTISPILTLVTMFSIPLMILILYYNRKIVRTRRKRVNERTSKVSTSMTEYITGARVSTNFAREDFNTKEFEIVNKDLTDEYIEFFRKGAIVFPFLLGYQNIVILMILVSGTIFISNNVSVGLTLGVLYLFIIYVVRFSQPISTLSSVYGEIQTGFASFERIIAYHDKVSSVPDLPNAKPLSIKNSEIELINVSFKYNSSKDWIIRNLNLHVKPKECIAIVGETGSGKTTLAYLISRLYEIQEGKILIDNQDIKQIKNDSLHKAIGMVPQDPYLFSETIRYNLCYGSDYTDEDLYNVLDLIGANFVKNLPKKLDTKVGERGGRLSIGQRQLISFARALITNPIILILDEATSSIDPQSELRIQQVMDKMIENRTTIIIAHRLSTVKKADRIIVLKDGKIIEEGNLKELIETNGVFSELYNLQYNNSPKLFTQLDNK
jgi:ATP-binding cassette subfamily B protein